MGEFPRRPHPGPLPRRPTALRPDRAHGPVGVDRRSASRAGPPDPEGGLPAAPRETLTGRGWAEGGGGGLGAPSKAGLGGGGGGGGAEACSRKTSRCGAARPPGIPRLPFPAFRWLRPPPPSLTPAGMGPALMHRTLTG